MDRLILNFLLALTLIALTLYQQGNAEFIIHSRA